MFGAPGGVAASILFITLEIPILVLNRNYHLTKPVGISILVQTIFLGNTSKSSQLLPPNTHPYIYSHVLEQPFSAWSCTFMALLSTQAAQAILCHVPVLRIVPEQNFPLSQMYRRRRPQTASDSWFDLGHLHEDPPTMSWERVQREQREENISLLLNQESALSTSQLCLQKTEFGSLIVFLLTWSFEL